MWHRFDLWRSCYWGGEEEEKEGIKEKRCGGEQGGSHITGTNCSRWRSQMGGETRNGGRRETETWGWWRVGWWQLARMSERFSDCIFGLFRQAWPHPFFIASHIKVSSLIFSTADIVISPTEVIDQPCGTVLLSACSIITVDFCPLTVWCPPPSLLFFCPSFTFSFLFFFFFLHCVLEAPSRYTWQRRQAEKTRFRTLFSASFIVCWTAFSFRQKVKIW